MTEYQIVWVAPGHYAVESESRRGKVRGFRSVTGFPSEEAARAWIAEQEHAKAEQPPDLPDEQPSPPEEED